LGNWLNWRLLRDRLSERLRGNRLKDQINGVVKRRHNFIEGPHRALRSIIDWLGVLISRLLVTRRPKLVVRALRTGFSWPQDAAHWSDLAYSIGGRIQYRTDRCDRGGRGAIGP
jgi:hypothetical protein